MQDALRAARARRRGRAELPPAARRSSSTTRAGIAFVVLRTARYVDEREEVEFGEVSIFIGPGFVITVRQGVASDLHGARLRLERAARSCSRRARRAVLWAILDKIVDDYAPVVEGLEARHRGGRADGLLRRGGADAPHLPAAPRGDRLLPRRAPAARPARGDQRGRRAARSAHGLRQYFRDVNDHLKLVNEEVVAQRDLLATILQANMAVVSVEQNEIACARTRPPSS